MKLKIRVWIGALAAALLLSMTCVAGHSALVVQKSGSSLPQLPAGEEQWVPGFSSQQIHMNKEGMKQAVEVGFKWIEIRIGNTLKKNPEMGMDELIEWAKKTKDQLDTAGLKVWSCHFPFGPGYDFSTLDEHQNQNVVQFDIKCLEIAKIFGAHVGVIHSSDEGVKPGERDQRLKNARKGLETLASAFQKAGLPMAVEILPRVMLGNTTKELDGLIKGLPNTGMTLDLNHIFYEKQEDVIRYFRNRIFHVHFSDYNGVEQHWNPMQGTMNWPAIMRAMQTSGYKGVMMFEIRLYGNPPVHPGRQTLYSTHLAWKKLMLLNEWIKVEKSDIKACQNYKKMQLQCFDVGTSAALTGQNKQGIEAAKKTGFQWMEIIVPNDIYLKTDAELKVWAKKEVADLQAVGMKLWSIHLPYGKSYDISAVDSAQNAGALKQQARVLELMKIFKPQVAVLHACAGKLAAEERNGVKTSIVQEREMRKTIFKSKVKDLAAGYKKVDVTLAIETLPAEYLGNTSTELLELIQGVPNLGVCLDINHIMLEDHAAAIRSLGKSIVTVHLSDHDAQADRHWLPYLGNIDWSGAMQALMDVNYEGVIMFEVSSKPKAPKPGYELQTPQMCMDAWRKITGCAASSN